MTTLWGFALVGAADAARVARACPAQDAAAVARWAHQAAKWSVAERGMPAEAVAGYVGAFVAAYGHCGRGE